MSLSRGCLLCIKVQMFIFNLIFWLGGCGILGVGVWLAVTQGKFATLSHAFPSLSAASLFMVAGSVIMVVGFIGCLGALTEHRCLLLTFFVVLLVIFLLEVVGMLLFITLRDKFHKYAEVDLKASLQFYDQEGNQGLTNAWDLVQIEFHCCGVGNYTDWEVILKEHSVPKSCCREVTERCTSDSDVWWKDPCYMKVQKYVSDNISFVWIFAACIIVIQVLGLVFSLVMYCQVVKAEKNYE
ncbi:tetraspanin-4-like [Ambystoma mexicanum]|uniref:tetraspanin-4-like n=1 Tax=Ambystoma mexicanum TaxID=8296 RepID=UPI0037E7366C